MTALSESKIMMRKMIAEFIGTFTLVFLGCGAAVIAGSSGIGGQTSGLGIIGISFAFGFALIGMAYSIGPISGCHINPAVSFGAVIAGRMTVFEMVRYWIAQVGGAIVGAIVLLAIMKGRMGGFDLADGLGNNGWGEGYLGEYGMVSAFIFELVATFLFLIVILGSTSPSTPAAMAGLAIGIALVVIHLVGIQVTGVSVNPARSIGPAVVSANASSIAQLWLFIVAPMLGALGAGILFRAGILQDKSIVDEV